MDRLSALPEEVMFHVLSFLLDPKMLVQTSVLAKGWRFHWSRIICFGFTKQVQVMPQTLNSFSGTSNHEFESWISAAFARNVRYLVVGLNYELTLPPCLFTSETLFYLRIFDCGSIPDGGCLCGRDVTVYFPALKKLVLDNVGFESEYSLTHLLLGCPVLEELMIERMNYGVCVVISETLTKLVIDVEDSDRVSIIIPSLRYLRFCARMSKMHSLRGDELDFLIEADIDLMSVAKFHISQTLINFVHALHNVKCLTLSTRQLMDIPTSYFSEWDIKFHNLTKLKLRTDWRFITCFLENADNLRALTILHMVDHSTQHWMEPKQVPACLVSHLETVNLVDFGWSKQHEFDIVKYILKNAQVLKRMEITCTQHCQLDWNAKFDVIKKFAKLEISSKACGLYINLE